MEEEAAPSSSSVSSVLRDTGALGSVFNPRQEM